MAVAQGPCPNCGAGIQFSVGASASQVCPYCRHVVVRTDRDWQNYGRIADIANTPSTLAVGDKGTLRGRVFEVVGRVQVDYGRGPWDEFYVSYQDGSWGWMAEAQGNLYVTQLINEPIALPPPQTITVDLTIPLGRYGNYRVAERRSAKVLSAEGELPYRLVPERFYADLHGPNGGFCTLDYGDGSKAPEIFLGSAVPLAEVQLMPRGGERAGAQKVKLQGISCPNCGGGLPPPSDPTITRIACKYCNAISEVATLQVVARQATAYAEQRIPLGSKGNLNNQNYVVIGFMTRSAEIEGERFRWNEYLLYGEKLGFRWIVEDEGKWLFIRPLSNAEVTEQGTSAYWHNRPFTLRNDNMARVDYVVGEFYWKVEVGEQVHARDFVSGGDVLSREATQDEVAWSYGTPLYFNMIATAFNLPETSAPSYQYSSSDSGGGGLGTAAWVVIIICIICCIIIAANSEPSDGSYASSGSGYHFSFGSSGGGGGWSSGGGFGGFGGK